MPRYEPSFLGKKYGRQFLGIMGRTSEKNKNSLMHIHVHVLFAQLAADLEDRNFEQMSFNKGQKLFGERAVAAMVKEYKQMEDCRQLKCLQN